LTFDFPLPPLPLSHLAHFFHRAILRCLNLAPLFCLLALRFGTLPLHFSAQRPDLTSDVFMASLF
jgi:hypothetical protein